jgi:hypothetical protein
MRHKRNFNARLIGPLKVKERFKRQKELPKKGLVKFVNLPYVWHLLEVKDVDARPLAGPAHEATLGEGEADGRAQKSPHQFQHWNKKSLKLKTFFPRATSTTPLHTAPNWNT